MRSEFFKLLSWLFLASAFCSSSLAQSPYKIEVVAKTGQAGIVSIAPEVSINDNGTVALIAKIAENGTGKLIENIFVGDGASGSLRSITPTISSNPVQEFSPSIQINNNDQIIVRRYVRIPSPLGEIPVAYMERWNGKAINTFERLAIGQSRALSPPGVEFDGIYSYPTINNIGSVLFGAFTLEQNRGIVDWLASISPKGKIKIESGSNQYRPVYADNGTFVTRTGDTKGIFLFNETFGLVANIADPNNGFISVGKSPAISDDGKIVAFAGDCAGISLADGTELTPGPGVFIAVQTEKGWRITRIAGRSGNGQLDPGETFTDKNGNGVFDLGENDSGLFSGFDLDSRISVSNAGFVVYKAVGTDGNVGIYSNLVDVDDQKSSWRVYDNISYPIVNVIAPAPVIRKGDAIPGLFSSVEDVAIYDSINNKEIPQFAIWVNLGGNNQAIVKATGFPSNLFDIDIGIPKHINGHNWSVNYKISANEGLIVQDVQLNTRYVIKKISIPYFKINTSKGGDRRAELKPSSFGDYNSRIIDFKPRLYPNKLVLQASYLVDNFSPNQQSALLVTQNYEFYAYNPEAYVEPSGELEHSQYFRPLAAYRYFEVDSDKLNSLELAQRFHSRLENKDYNNVTVIKDADFPFTIPFRGENPLQREASIRAIKKGKPSILDNTQDNIHFTFLEYVQEPVILNGSIIPHGAPEAMHMHWHWDEKVSLSLAILSRLTAASAFNYNSPLIPDGSDQDLNIAIVTYNPSNQEEFPEDSYKLVNDEALVGQNQVVWYNAIGHQKHDRFFEFGGFLGNKVVYATGDVTEKVEILQGIFTRHLNLAELTPTQFDTTLYIVSKSGGIALNGDWFLIKEPLRLVLDDLPSDVTVLNKTGVTPEGKPYIDLPISPDGLLGHDDGVAQDFLSDARDAIKVTIGFSNPSRVRIKFRPHLISLGGTQ